MKKVSIIGLFRMGTEAADGQSIKTRIVAEEIEKNLGAQQVRKIDTYGWKKHPFKLFFNCVKAVFDSANVVFLTDAGGIKVFPWLLSIANVFTKRKIYYVVVGGWLIHFVNQHKILSWFLKRLDGVFVETTIMKKTLEDFDFKNIYLMPNFKKLMLISENELPSSVCEPYRFCIFSRIMKEKGVAYAVDAVQSINSHYGRNVCTLDIYGQIDSNQIEWFNDLKDHFTDAVCYGGIVPFDESVDVLKDYYALLFPTQFYTEGIPGTIIDAYASGLPVIASEWESVFDIVESGVTGLTYSFDTPDALREAMIKFIETPENVLEMKRNCLKRAEQYLPDAVINTLLSNFI